MIRFLDKIKEITDKGYSVVFENNDKYSNKIPIVFRFFSSQEDNSLENKEYREKLQNISNFMEIYSNYEFNINKNVPSVLKDYVSINYGVEVKPIDINLQTINHEKYNSDYLFIERFLPRANNFTNFYIEKEFKSQVDGKIEMCRADSYVPKDKIYNLDMLSLKQFENVTENVIKVVDRKIKLHEYFDYREASKELENSKKYDDDFDDIFELSDEKIELYKNIVKNFEEKHDSKDIEEIKNYWGRIWEDIDYDSWKNADKNDNNGGNIDNGDNSHENLIDDFNEDVEDNYNDDGDDTE